MVPVLSGSYRSNGAETTCSGSSDGSPGRKRPRVTEPVTAVVEGESVGDVLLYDGRSYRIVKVCTMGGVKALGVYEPGTA